MVAVCVEPDTMLDGLALQASLNAAPTGTVCGTVIRQKMP